MQTNLLRSLFKKTVYSKQFFFYTKQLTKISFQKKAYSKKLIYTKQLNTTSFQKTTYSKQLITISFSKTAYSKQLIYGKQLIYPKQFITISVSKTTYLYKTAYYDLFFKNNLLKIVTCLRGRLFDGY